MVRTYSARSALISGLLVRLAERVIKQDGHEHADKGEVAEDLEAAE